MYIPVAIKRLKALELPELLELQKRGIKTLKMALESEAQARAAGKQVAVARVPLTWAINAKERYQLSGLKQESAFDGFVSDWIEKWV